MTYSTYSLLVLRHFIYWRFRHQIGKGIFKNKEKICGKRKKKKERKYQMKPKLESRILIKGQNQSDAAKGVIDQFMHVYWGAYIISTILPHSSNQIVDNIGKLRGEFNKTKLKPYTTENDPKRHKIIIMGLGAVEQERIKQPWGMDRS